MQNLKIASQLDEELSSLPLGRRIETIAKRFSNPVFTTNLGMEDQVLTWALSGYGHTINIITQQTGQLSPETLALIDITRERYGLRIEEFFLASSTVAHCADAHGLDGFYKTIETRQAYCHIRKFNPLGKGLNAIDAWITGLRREQSQNRMSTPMAEWDHERNIMKLNPLADWKANDIKEAIAAHEIPVNPLHARNYPSIGYEPCTRALKSEEDGHAWRWWWEQESAQECGLHLSHQTAIQTKQRHFSGQNA